MTSANELWKNMLKDILDYGEDQIARGLKFKELLRYSTIVPMTSPVITLKQRKLGYQFMQKEAAWILSGDFKVETIKPFSKTIENFSDDGHFYFGAYGPKIVQQLPYILHIIQKDLFTRQAVINIWRESPMQSKDIPCTVSIQFMVRRCNDKLLLHCFDTMRSSDAWLGVPYDWFNFSMLSFYLCLLLNDICKINIEPGNLYFTANSEHLYSNGNFGYTLDDVNSVIKNNEEYAYEDIKISSFSSAKNLIDSLNNCLILKKI